MSEPTASRNPPSPELAESGAVRTPMTDAQFHARAQETLAMIEAALDRWLHDDVIDIDSHRSGGLLELECPSGEKIVINTQPPVHELWLASRTGGYHFRWMNGRWIDARDGGEFFAVLSRELHAQSGLTLAFGPV